MQVLNQDWIPWTQEWVNYRNTRYTYDDQDRQIGIIYQEWDTSSDSWVNSRRVSYGYDDLNHQILSEYFDWNSTAEEWDPTSRYDYGYNDTGQRLNYKRQEFGPSEYGWQGNSRVLQEYDEQDSLISLINQDWDSGLETWINYSQQQWTYENGQLVYNAYLDWIDSTQSWVVDNAYTWTYDTLGNLLSESTYRSSPSKYQTLYLYDSTGLLKEQLFQTYDFVVERWNNNSRSIYAYYPSNNLLSRINQRWEDSVWINTNQVIHSYDSVGHLIEYLAQHWQGDWVNSERTRYVYNHDGSIESSTSQGWSGTWVNESQWTYQYDAYGFMSEQIMSYWDGSTGAWQPSLKYYFEHDQNGRRLLDQSWRWDLALSDWVKDREKIKSFDDEGRLLEDRLINYRWGYGFGSLYAYDTYGNRSEEVYIDWDNLLEEWVFENRLVSVFSDSAVLDELYFYEWNTTASNWQLKERGIVTNDAFGNPVSIVAQALDENSGLWVNYAQIASVYDSENHLLVEQTWNVWTATAFGWFDESRCDYYYSEHLVALPDVPENTLHCVYPNPFSAHNSIRCEEIDGAASYTAQLFDLMGRPIFSRKIVAGETFGMHVDVPQGAYLLRIDDGNQVVHRNTLMIY